jgi:gamma-glutamyl-gamma-aminobutyrate hydrolase PuuD
LLEFKEIFPVLYAHLPSFVRSVFALGLGEECYLERLLKKIAGQDNFEVNSYHHQAVDPNALGTGLKVTAIADDGVVEAIEGTGEVFRLGLQFHAERHRDEDFSERIFNSFIQATSK